MGASATQGGPAGSASPTPEDFLKLHLPPVALATANDCAFVSRSRQ
jgi:hypothetical protein